MMSHGSFARHLFVTMIMACYFTAAMAAVCEPFATGLAQALNTEHDGTIFIEPLDDKDISIEQIRQLYHDTRAVRNHQLTVID